MLEFKLFILKSNNIFSEETDIKTEKKLFSFTCKFYVWFSQNISKLDIKNPRR